MIETGHKAEGNYRPSRLLPGRAFGHPLNFREIKKNSLTTLILEGRQELGKFELEGV